MSQNSKAFDYIARVPILGDSSVGKSAFAFRFFEKGFCPRTLTPMACDYQMKIIEVDLKRVKLQIWDTVGQERFRALNQTYYRSAMGIVLCYATNNRESFERVGYWMEEIGKYARSDVCVVLVGNKSDLHGEKVVSFDEGRQLAESFEIKFFETSAKEGVNVDEMLSAVARDMNKVFENKKNEHHITLSKKNNPQEKTVCYGCS